jgi:hypothetical protein
MISAFSRFSALLGLLAKVLANIPNTARAVTTPVKINTMPIIYAALLACVFEVTGNTEIVHWVELEDVGYRSCCPKPVTIKTFSLLDVNFRSDLKREPMSHARQKLGANPPERRLPWHSRGLGGLPCYRA